ncbi:hypothetical protein [Brevundimonas vesicularis]|uniref:Phage protein n=1 Tax=Brevundimonas vesicularis TaxID=41276 RepID=A0A1Z3U541_BREVE|nr:hypothetical protein [Brevundimonas vesicularis]ASE38409.1 hypothetical protein CEP68_02195 [Brevundimonas vesicularis]
MSKFRKKPVVIDAALFDGELVGEPVKGTGNPDKVQPGTCPDWFPAVVEVTTPNGFGWKAGDVCAMGDKLYIGTLEGTLTASPGDWIIRGVKGELYPCKPDIFRATYEPAE